MNTLAAATTSQLVLAQELTKQTKVLCEGLEKGNAPLLELVTPVTARLLTWWFGEEAKAQRPGLNFHPGQRQAILNAIVAHEVLGADQARWGLLELYRKVAPSALLASERLNDVSAPKHAHPKYCMKMATGTGKTWVMQALLIWQLLNKSAALDAGLEDPRFTRHFLIVAPGLIVYDRLLDAFCGKLTDGGSGARDFATSDVAQFAELFIPEADRPQVLAFVRNNVCNKHEIGVKAIGNGMIAIANWHHLSEVDEADVELEDEEALSAQKLPQQVVSGLLRLTPGVAKGNELSMLDRRYARGNVLAFLAGLPELMVFNDEAHHIHEIKSKGEISEVEWQRSLTRIAANKGRKFVQVDFSATPYNDVGSGKNHSKVFFPHIIVDFDLQTAIRSGLVKSLVLDRRQEVAALPLNFASDRDAIGNPSLSEGQRVMLRAGLTKLRRLEAAFAKISPGRYPKMLVTCEDTKVTPLVAEFLRAEEGLLESEVLTIDSGTKNELTEKEWAPIRERLYGVDRHQQPKVIVNVLMLREGFDVNNICVIVPLRSSQAQILLEQTIGRGLRLMWREPEYQDIKNENREAIRAGREPGSLIDVLSIVEHPAFTEFYRSLIEDGDCVQDCGGDDDERDSTGDLFSVGLRDNYQDFDFGVPFVIAEAEEVRDFSNVAVSELPAFTTLGLAELKQLVGKGDVFASLDVEHQTQFGQYRVAGGQMQVAGYNAYLQRLTLIIDAALAKPRSNSGKSRSRPYLQAQAAQLAGWLEDYIWHGLFGETFNPMEDENWRILLLDPVVAHLKRVFTEAILEAEQSQQIGDAEVELRYLSEVPRLVMRRAHSMEVSKSIYTHQNWPVRSGGLERSFLEWAQADSQVLAFCKVSETKHGFVHLRYLREDGVPAFYSPDFLVRTADAVYMVETKAQDQLTAPNVVRKRRAASAWCERVNALPEERRGSPQWNYVLLGQAAFESWRARNGQLVDLLEFEKIRPTVMPGDQQRLFV